MGKLLVGFIKSVIRVTPLHTLSAIVIQRLQERGTFTVNMADCGAARRCVCVPMSTHYTITHFGFTARRCLTPNFEKDILHHVDVTHSMRTRTIECGMGVHHRIVWELLHEQQLLPYHPQSVYAMGPADFAVHANFCMWFLHHCMEDPQFP